MAVYDPPGRIILTHAPHGLRVELAIEAATQVEIWISPLPATSLSAVDRNFSNRDDHLRLWDLIQLPGLTEGGFRRCDYDPFHVVVHFDGNRTLHLVPLLNSPAVAIWCDHPQAIVVKSDRAARSLERSPRGFRITQSDRGRLFEFGAHLGEGGAWRHPAMSEEGRSQYAWTELAPGVGLVFSVILPEQHPVDAVGLAGLTPSARLDENEALIQRSLQSGGITVRTETHWQPLIDVNRRVLLAMQDPMGAIRAALNRIYYLIWVRDGSIIAVQSARNGDVRPLTMWVRFLLANPTRIEREEPAGRAFLMLVSQTTKWEEDGWFYAVWSTFTAWTQTGDDAWRAPDILAVLEDAGDWLDRRCYNSDRGAYGRYFCCESPFAESRDADWDMAVGKPQPTEDIRWEGQSITRSYDLYINALNWSACQMLAALAGAERGRRWTERAHGLKEFLDTLGPGDALPHYGDLQTAEGKWLRAPAYGLDVCDYEWALCLAEWTWAPARHGKWRADLVANMQAKPSRRFLAAYFSVLASVDTLDVPEDQIAAALDYAARQCARPGDKLPMAGAMIEMLDVPDGDLWHDVRPQAFSIGPFLGAIANLGVRRLPFGLSVRANRRLSRLSHFLWRGRELNFIFEAADGPWPEIGGEGMILSPHTLQLPETWLDQLPAGKVITVRGQRSASSHPVWSSSNVLLQTVESNGQGVLFRFDAFGGAWIEIRRAAGHRLRITRADGTEIPTSVTDAGSTRHVGFELFGSGSLHLG